MMQQLSGRDIHEETILFQGAGEAGCGIAELVAHTSASRKGCSVEEARKRIFLFDSKGLVYKGEKDRRYRSS